MCRLNGFSWPLERILSRLLMLQRLLRQMQHIVAALGLLIIALIAVELWLRATRPFPVPVVASQADLFDQSDLVPSTTQHHQMRPLTEIRGSVRFRTNSLGLRGDEPEIPAPAGTFRVLVLGDEAVAGPWLQDEHTLSAQLQKRLAARLQGPVEVINGGVPGYSPVLSLLQYEHVLQQLNPDLVVLHIDMSDVADDAVYRGRLRQEGVRNVCIHPVLAASGRSRNGIVQMMKQSAVVRLLSGELASESNAAADRDRYMWTRADSDEVSARVRHAMESATQLHKMIRDQSGSLIVTSSPVHWQVISPRQMPSLSKKCGVTGDQPVATDLPFRILEAWGQSVDVPVCSVVDVFRTFESPEALFRSDAARLTKYGTALHAKVLENTILKTPSIVAGHLKSGRQ